MTEYNTTTISGKVFADMLRAGSGRLAEHRQSVNDLNVFPIPDGDTGDNMLMTFDRGAAAAEVAGERLCDAAKAASDGMLLGARGNSGVILSRIFSGITSEFSTIESADIDRLMRSMSAGVRSAYSAVPHPVEGTILTVFKDAVAYANSTAKSGEIAEYFDALLDEMRRSLDRTTDLLPALAEAGVVDSGGAGLLCIFEGMRDALFGKMPERASEKGEFSVGGATCVDFSLFSSESTLEFGYCTEFLLRLQSSKCDIKSFDLDTLIKYLQSVGDSIVAFVQESIVKVHVHTKVPGDVLNHCQKYGEFLTLKIENMTFQNKAAIARGDNAQKLLAKKARKKTGIVAVAAGEGLKETFRSLGADAVVDGGQSMNPSVADMIDAFKSADAERIFVFPNNKNIIMTAKQASELYDGSKICVLETRTVGEGYAAMSMMDTEGDTDTIMSELSDVISQVRTLSVSRAERCAKVGGVSVEEGSYIGFTGDKILSQAKCAEEALCRMLEAEDLSGYGVMLLLVGEDAKTSVARTLCDRLREKYKKIEIIMIDGGQPIYDYTAVLE